MARRNRAPQVARPKGRAALIEWGKNLLIAALACSAVFLAAQTPMVAELKNWLAPPAQTAQPETRQLSEAVEPYLLAVRNDRGLYGAAYDETLVDRAFDQLSPLLGEGFATAEAAGKITRHRWQTLLESPGVYCAFQGQPPLEALTAWLGGAESSLAGSAMAALLAWDGSNVWLCWRDGEGYWAAKTQVIWAGRMDAALEEFNPNGAAFAYSLVESDWRYGELDPDTLVSMTTLQPQVYNVSRPAFSEDRDTLSQLLGYLGFQSGGSMAYESGGSLVINEGGDSLRANPSGTVTYHTGEEGRYPVAAAGNRATAQAAAQAAWDLLNRACVGWKGEGRFLLTGTEATQEGWTVTFHYRLAGIPVLVGETGWAAQFTIKGREIADFTLNLRTYSDSGSASVVLRERLAAAALSAQGGTGGRLTLCYSDGGGATVTPGWISGSQ